MIENRIPGLGIIDEKYKSDFIELERGGNGLWKVGADGVEKIFTPLDKKVEFIVFGDKTFVYVKSSMGYPAIYPLEDIAFEGPAEAVLMDLDGTSVKSEDFWMWIIEKTIGRLSGKSGFSLEASDLPHVSGHSVSEHLQYCINKYCQGRSLEEARKYYFEITNRELQKILEGNGRQDAFRPGPGLKEFLMKLKENRIKIGLVTSGLYEKAWPEIISAFRTMNMGDPLDFYDAIITAGNALRKGQAGTLGELAPKPHPWLYAETARVGLGIEPSNRHKVIGIEDSSAGIVSIRLAGFTAVGIKDGNISASGTRALLKAECDNLLDALPLILGRE